MKWLKNIINKNKKNLCNLCNSCKHSMPTCPGVFEKMRFGKLSKPVDGWKYADNVLECNGYEKNYTKDISKISLKEDELLLISIPESCSYNDVDNFLDALKNHTPLSWHDKFVITTDNVKFTKIEKASL